MITRANIIDKIFTLMLVSVFFTNGITKLLNLEQTINWARELHAYVEQNVVQKSSGSKTPELQGDKDRVLVQFN